jgi:hypothetical protein
MRPVREGVPCADTRLALLGVPNSFNVEIRHSSEPEKETGTVAD